MTQGNPDSRGDAVMDAVSSAFQHLKDGAFSRAVDRLERALEMDLEDKGVAAALSCAIFWEERQEQEPALADPYEKGELVMSQWKAFTAHAAQLGEVPEECMLAVRHYAFTRALGCYLEACGADGEDPEALLRVGRCYKALGDYGSAIEFLEKANGVKRESAEQLAELADAYALVSESRKAKLFFREAFFLDPQAVDLAACESQVIRRLADKVAELGYSGPEVNEWLPVYATIYGVWNVKREMKPLELGKLKQSIYLLEKEVDSHSEARGLVPRLINRYFWLIDHYLSAGEMREKIEEILSRIRELDARVYSEYAL